MNPGDDLAARLAEATRIIEVQSRELEILRSGGSGALGERIRGLLELTATAGVVSAPASEREGLRTIVQVAAAVLDAEAAALFLVDEDNDVLRFEVALGGKSDVVENQTIPLGEGLAGYVAATGQPIAVSSTEKDSRFAAAFAQKVAYVPKTVLCVPMNLNDRTIGVLEMLDKGGGVPFSVRDIELLGQFAKLAAYTVDHMLLFRNLRNLFRRLIGDVVRDDDALNELGRRFADDAAGLAQGESLKLAALVWEVSRQGTAARRHATDVLASVSKLVASVAAYPPSLR